jgi:nitrogenase subunit NifH
MAIAIEWSTHGPGSTAAKYDKILALLHAAPGGPHPGEGCLFHWVRVANDGLHGVDVFDTQQHFDQFVANVLGPAVVQVGMSAPQTKSHDIHAFLTAH